MFENLKLIECFEIADSKLRPFIEAISTGYGGAGPPATALVRPCRRSSYACAVAATHTVRCSALPCGVGCTPALVLHPRTHARLDPALACLHPAHAHAHSSQNAL
jgi:hypothetical protein